MLLLLIVGIFMHTEACASLVAYINTSIYSGSELLPHDDAFLIKDGRFFKIASTNAIKKMAPKNTKIIDLKGQLVMPGFIESHAHIVGLGKSKLILDLKGLKPQEIVRLIEQQALKQQDMTWIIGRGWDQNSWENPAFPDKNLISHIKNPVFLTRVDGHAAWVNDAALKMSSISPLTKDPQGGQIIRDKTGAPTGTLIDTAMNLASAHMTKPNKNDLKLYLNLGMKEAISHGITSLHDAGSREDVLNLFIDYAKNDQLLLRLYAMIDGDDEALVLHYLKNGPINIKNMLTIRSIKYFADGALGSKGALLLSDYIDTPGYKGLALTDYQTLLARTKRALDAGFQVATHAIGDGANKLVLDAYEAALKESKATNARLRIEHAQLVDPSDHHRFKTLAVIASMQPIHCTSDMLWITKKISSDLLPKRAYPWRSLLNAQATLAFGSDAPVENINPLLGVFAAVSRAHPKSTISFLPEEKLTLKEALLGYYAHAAYAEFAEDKKGAIKEGYFADFIVFQENLLHPTKSSFLQAQPKQTIIGGNVVYSRDN